MKLPRLFDPKSAPEKATTVVTYNKRYTAGETTGGLSVLFSALCIVDLFGVFPVITLPKSVITCGIYGVPLVMSVMSLQLYTAVLLGRSWLIAHEIAPHIREKNRFPYAAVAELAFGTPARRVVTFLIDATVFGSGIPNFILAAQSLQIFWWKISGGAIGVSYCIWMLLLALLLCPVMWLGSPKDMKSLALASVFIVSTVAISTWTCIMLDEDNPPPSTSLLEHQPKLQDFLMAYGILSFQFDIHPMLLTLQVDMKDSRRINSAVLGGFGITGFMFVITTILAASRYGLDVDNNILQGIPPSITLYMVALLVTLQLCLSCAVSNSALFLHIEDLLNIPRNFCIKRCLVRSSIVALAVFIAESVPRFDLVMGLVGSTLTGPLMFICPPLFFLKLSYMRSQMNSHHRPMKVDNRDLCIEVASPKQNGAQNGNGRLSNLPPILRSFQTKYKTFTNFNQIKDEEDYTVRWYDVMLAAVVMSMGIGATFVATYTSWADSIAYAEFSPPCLINASEAARSFLQQIGS